MNIFKHSGDLGDIIYSLPTIKKLGGGILLLDSSGGVTEDACKKQCRNGKTKFNKDGFNFLKSLLINQDYIFDCKEYNAGDRITHNLDTFRYKFLDPNSRSKTKNLLDMHLETFKLDVHDANESWLKPSETIKLERKVLICRSPRYQSNFSWYDSNKYYLRDNAIFLGLQKEHELFEWTFDVKIPYVKVDDALHMCNLIAGCDLFIANQTFSLSVAIGLGSINIIQEVDPRVPNVVFSEKKNMQYV